MSARLHALPPSIRHRLDWPAIESTLRACQDPQVAAFSQAVTTVRECLSTAFNDGCDVADLVHAQAFTTDRLLITLWELLGLQANTSVALVAVGGYGRGELHPGSDIDILILHDISLDEAAQEGLSRFFTLLWDMDLQPGHSVRSIDECVIQAAADITVATNLVECRPLAGNKQLLERLEALIAPQHMWNSRAFFAAKLEEQTARHQRYGETAYRLEPNIKESPGGLRDIQMIGWVTKRQFGSGAFEKLVSQGFLTLAEYEDLMAGQSYLWRVRFALHMLSGRKEDRLLFDFQRRMATLLGFTDADNNLAVEQFMQEYFRNVIRLERLNEMLLQHFREAILLDMEDDDIIPINRRFQSRRGYLEVTDPQVFLRYPPALLEVFLLLQQHPELKGIRASTIRLIRTHRDLINDAFRADLGCRSLFMEILRQPHGVTRQLRRMNRYGVLARYLPAFGQIVGRMQYDLFHVYTVDEHTLTVIRNLRRFAIAEHNEEVPECSRIYRLLPKPELLLLAGLFHDIAKGRGGDHSELGAEDARRFCMDHGLSIYDANLVSWLVKSHLLMSLTAQRRDISDPDVIHEFALQMGNAMRLNYLYLLTVADIRSTNPKMWNSWKNALLSNLYDATLRMLRRGLENPPDQDELLGEVQMHALSILRQRGIDEPSCLGLWAQLDADYFLRHSADEIVWHTLAIHDAQEADLPLVQVREETARGGTEIFLYTRDHPNVFAQTTTALMQLGLDIVDARIITTATGYSLNTFLVLEDSGGVIHQAFRAAEIVDYLHQHVADPQRAPKPIRRSQPRQLKHFDVPTHVHFDAQSQRQRTVLHVTTADRPGLLAKISLVLTDCGLRVHNAKIATAGETAEDVFYVTDLEGEVISDPQQQAQIRDKLVAALEMPAAPSVVNA